MLTVPDPETDARKRTVAIVGAVAVTAGIAALALHLGHWAYKSKNAAMHQRRLERLLSLKPHVRQVVAAFEQEGTRPLAVARTPEELAAAADRWAGPRRDETVAEGSRRSSTRVFSAGDVRYFVYFDESGTMNGFTLVVD